MQLIRPLICAMLLLPTAAGACDIQISTPGTLGLSSDGRTLSSVSGLPTVVIISDLSLLSPTTITISNIRLTDAPAGFASPVTFSGTYDATWTLLGQSNGPISPTATFSAGPILNLAITITIHNTVTSANGFKQGTYKTKTTVTCT